MDTIFDKVLQIQKYPGKGGWSYVVIDILPSVEKKTKFGMVRVKGFIDDYEISQYNLMPMGNGNLFLPIKAEIRKKIKKEAGDFVKIVLSSDESPVELIDELKECLEMNEGTLKTFMGFSQAEQKQYIDWIYQAKNIDTKTNRILKMIALLQKGKRLYDL
jgi:Domain of unknown function (DUF1905)/Bacteriocin-protection, YdeI or OmpD-Associated